MRQPERPASSAVDGATEWAAQHGGGRGTKRGLERTGDLASGLGQREVGAPGVLAGLAPLGGSVAHQPDVVTSTTGFVSHEGDATRSAARPTSPVGRRHGTTSTEHGEDVGLVGRRPTLHRLPAVGRDDLGAGR